MAVSRTSVNILPFPPVWGNRWVLSRNAKEITHKWVWRPFSIYVCHVQLSQMPLQNTSYLLVCRKTLSIDARFGCTLWPASLLERPLFITWSITVALISSETTALDLPLILLPPSLPPPSHSSSSFSHFSISGWVHVYITIQNYAEVGSFCNEIERVTPV